MKVHIHRTINDDSREIQSVVHKSQALERFLNEDRPSVYTPIEVELHLSFKRAETEQPPIPKHWDELEPAMQNNLEQICEMKCTCTKLMYGYHNKSCAKYPLNKYRTIINEVGLVFGKE